jgi:hypothetical protein
MGKVIPDLYYDLIARILPGGSAAALLTYVVDEKSLIGSLHTEYKLSFLIFAGYIIGMILTGLSSLIFDGLFAKLVDFFSATNTNAVGGRKHYAAIERITRQKPEQSGRIWKMVAEKVFFENCITAVLLFLITLPHISKTGPILNALPLCLLPLAIGWLLRTLALSGRVSAANEA